MMTAISNAFPLPEVFEVPLYTASTILCGYRGSIAHNMYVPKDDPNSIDDIDIMGVVIAPEECYFGLQDWGSRGTKEYKKMQWDCVFYEIRKAFRLWLQGNPNVLSLLWLRPEHYLGLNLPGKLILENRNMFNGKHVYNAFVGYASAQLQKMELRDPAELRLYLAVTAEMKHRGIHPNQGTDKPEPLDRTTGEAKDVQHWTDEKLRKALTTYQKKGENLGYLGDKRKQLVLQHGYDAKNASHCIRLLRMCVSFLNTGVLEVYRSEDAAELLAIKRGEWPLDKIKARAEALLRLANHARDDSPLPDGPDEVGAEKLLIHIMRRWMRACGSKLIEPQGGKT